MGLPAIQVPFDSDEFEHHRVHDEIQFTLIHNQLQLWKDIQFAYPHVIPNPHVVIFTSNSKVEIRLSKSEEGGSIAL